MFVESIDQFHIAARRFCLKSLTLQYTKLDGSAPKRIFLVLGFILQSTRPTKKVVRAYHSMNTVHLARCSVDELNEQQRWPCYLLNDKQMSNCPLDWRLGWALARYVLMSDSSCRVARRVFEFQSWCYLATPEFQGNIK